MNDERIKQHIDHIPKIYMLAVSAPVRALRVAGFLGRCNAVAASGRASSCGAYLAMCYCPTCRMGMTIGFRESIYMQWRDVLQMIRRLA
jgi:hypothetical protein